MDYDIFVIKVGRSNIFVINRFWKEKKIGFWLMDWRDN